MVVTDKKIIYDGIKLKAKSGEYKDGSIKVDFSSKELNVGGLKFPLVALNKITFDPDNILVKSEGKLLISNKNVWYTPNTISIEVEPTTATGQGALITVQHNDTVLSTTNLAPVPLVFVHELGQPINILATNFSTGAVDTFSITCVTGQAYRVSALSSSSTTGELKEVCVRKEYDLVNVNNIYTSSVFNGVTFYSQSRGKYGTEAEAISRLNDVYIAHYLSTAKGVNVIDNYVEQALASDIYVVNITTQERMKLIPSTYLMLQPGNYIIERVLGVTPTNYTKTTAYTAELALVSTPTQGEQLIETPITIIEPGNYIINVKDSPRRTDNADTVQISANPKQYEFFYRYTCGVQTEVSIHGPLELVCVDKQTQDTRQTQYYISLRIEELN